jgi:hypothetical protein
MEGDEKQISVLTHPINPQSGWPGKWNRANENFCPHLLTFPCGQRCEAIDEDLLSIAKVRSRIARFQIAACGSVVSSD